MQTLEPLSFSNALISLPYTEEINQWQGGCYIYKAGEEKKASVSFFYSDFNSLFFFTVTALPCQFFYYMTLLSLQFILSPFLSRFKLLFFLSYLTFFSQFLNLFIFSHFILLNVLLGHFAIILFLGSSNFNFVQPVGHFMLF